MITIIMNITTNKEVLKMICEKCSYQWSSRVKEPKECPRCKIRLDYKGGKRK